MSEHRPLVQVAPRGRVLELSLDNPPDNRMTPEMLGCLDRALDQFEAEPFDVLAITGAGKVFSKGFAIAEALQSTDDCARQRRSLAYSNAVFSRLARLARPAVAAINGACLGGGLELALACHFRVCAEKTRLGLPEIWINLVPGLGGFYRLARLAGHAKALELVALGDLIPAEEALRLNIVHRVFPRNEFAVRTEAFVKALLLADRRVLGEVLRLAACSEPAGEEDNIRQGMESFGRSVQWLQQKS